ncbi:MAG: prepilin-type N-terminal cleavage/methylation domain-containing protein [Planctomycetales bacterium]|nr:prepilin-type N-terminal cleavage/methylation domain-containing protein [Planctomycetales bacterium]
MFNTEPHYRACASRHRVPGGRRRAGRVVDGFTLVELLVALTIASVLTAIALPTLKDSMRQNSLSRSAAIVKGAFINARAQAIRTGRPFGVVIERRTHDIGSGAASGLNYTVANYSTRLYYVQSPMEYRGDYQEALAYPVFEDSNTGATTDSVAPRLFVPRGSAGLLFAAADSSGTPLANATAAKTLLNIGTRFSVGQSGYVFEVTNLEQITLSTTSSITSFGGSRALYHPAIPPTDGTLVSFNYLDFSPRHASTPPFLVNVDPPPSGTRTLPIAAGLSSYPAGISPFQATEFKFRTNPVRAPLAPINMIGKTVIDLSVSGTSADPIAFNSQTIIDQFPASNIPPLAANTPLTDVIVMFAADGRMDGVYNGQRVVTTGPQISGFLFQRIDPSSTVSFNVGFIDGLVDNIDDIARYPEMVTDTDFQINATDPPLATPAPPSALTVNKTPNFANTDCAWVSIQPLSGNVTLENVASQTSLANLSAYYGFQPAPNNPFARNVARARVHQARRLTTSGAIQ